MLKIPKDSDIVEIGEYKSAKIPVKVQCRHGHTWQVIPSNLHSRGNGSKCPVCAGKETELVDGVHKIVKKKTTARFSQELADLTKEVELVGEYTGAGNYVTLRCLHGHTWKSIATNVLTRLSDRTCGECFPKLQGLPILGVDVVQAKLPEYLHITQYKNTVSPIQVLDTRCGHVNEVWYSNAAHKGMYKCFVCNPNLSNQERELRDFISYNCPGEWIEFNDRSILEGKELDIVLPDRGISFEYNGSYWHSEAKVSSSYHIEKTNAVKAFGFRLIHVDEMFWTTKQEIVKSRILQILGKSERIYARKTTVKQIPFPRDFLNANHLQGAGSPTSYNYGLFLQEELVAVMTFSIPRFTKDKELELVRYCSKLNTTVVGGASKLLKCAPSNSIVTYADRRFSEGNLYKKLGFKYSHTTTPGYYYTRSGKYFSRYQCQKHKLKALLPEFYSDELSESEIMRNAGFNKVYDAGNLVYTM